MNEKGEIVNLSHVDKAALETSTLMTKSGTKAKSKGKVAHYDAFVYLRDKLKVCGFVSCYKSDSIRSRFLV
jgi:hypothetical protein